MIFFQPERNGRSGRIPLLWGWRLVGVFEGVSGEGGGWCVQRRYHCPGCEDGKITRRGWDEKG